MRGVQLASCAGFLSLVLMARDGGADAQAPRVYVAAGSEVVYTVAAAPLPARQLGPVALAWLDRLQGAAVAVPALLGDPTHESPDWPLRVPPQAREARLPLAAGPAGQCGDCATAIGDTDRERIAAVRVAAPFTVGAEVAQLEAVQLRVRYRDGLVAYLNGREVARRNITDAGPMEPAERAHGPEWETFHIPVVPGLLTSGANLLAVEVRPAADRLAPELDLELAAAAPSRLVRGPLVQRVGSTSATVVFETDLPVTGAVTFVGAHGQERTAVSAAGGLAVRHELVLDDLPVAAAVPYRVHADGKQVAESSFHTVPAAGAVLRFAVFGDVRGGHRVHEQLTAAILAEAPDFVLVTGDLVLRGSDEADWQRFFAIAQPLLARTPYYPAIGNHDLGKAGDQQRRMSDVFALWPGPASRPPWGHWHAFAIAGVHFVMLDSNSLEHPEQLAWLEAELDSARGARAIFAVAHDGPYSRGLHGGNEVAAALYAPLLAKAGATVLFTGHDHLYQRGQKNGLAYVVSGGGGAPLYPVTCGIRGRPRCAREDGMQFVASEHHYVMVTVYPTFVHVCAKRPDRTPLEPCVRYPLRSSR